MTTKIKTRFLPATDKLPGRVRALVVAGPETGRRETFNYRQMMRGGWSAHESAARRLAEILGLEPRDVREVEFSNSGSVFEVKP